MTREIRYFLCLLRKMVRRRGRLGRRKNINSWFKSGEKKETPDKEEGGNPSSLIKDEVDLAKIVSFNEPFTPPSLLFLCFTKEESEISLVVCFLDSFFSQKENDDRDPHSNQMSSFLFSCLLRFSTWCLPVSFVFLLFLSTNRDLKTVFSRLIFFSSSLNPSSCVISFSRNHRARKELDRNKKFYV